jgi:ribA/ribD-fused uncharacterized protein
MAGGYMLRVNDIPIRTSEALYQACRFPHLPEVQRLIIEERSPMAAKMKSKPFRSRSRADWDVVRVDIMRWCLRVKLAQHRARFGGLLMQTGSLAIVEESGRDRFWGAVPSKENPSVLVGENVLGSLLGDMRAQTTEADPIEEVQPLIIADFSLLGVHIKIVRAP